MGILLVIPFSMKCFYWCQGNNCPAETKVEKDFKNDRVGRRAFDDRLEDLIDADFEQCMKQRWIKPVKGSNNKLQEWIVDLPKGTARMFLVLHNNCLCFLHFFIKKSPRKIKTPQKEIDIAESRAKMFWENNRKKEN